MANHRARKKPRPSRPSRPRISLCMIARDEEKFLRLCLESARAVADEIILVDTGSQDSTVSIAEQFGARVLRYAWDDDFAAARNHGLAAATGQWLLVLDADERLDPGSAPRIRGAVEEGNFDSGCLQFVNVSEDGPCGRRWLAARLFRRTPGMRYVGRIHEQMVHPLTSIRTRVIDALVYHYGYQASIFAERRKQERNARLLDRALEDAEHLDPVLRANYLFHHANLASNEELVRRYEALVAFIRGTWGPQPPRAPWITGALAEYARILNDLGRYTESSALAEQLLARHGESPMLRYLLARSRAAQGDLTGAEKQLQRILGPAPQISAEHMQYTQDLDLVVGRSRFLMGLLREQQGRLDEAASHYEAAVNEEPEQDLMRRQLVCVLVRLGRYQEALASLERAASLISQPQPGTDCLGFVLALLTRSVARLGFWGEKVRQLAGGFPPAARILARVEQLGPYWPYRLEDFPEIFSGILPRVVPGAFPMPQTSR